MSAALLRGKRCALRSAVCREKTRRLLGAQKGSQDGSRCHRVLLGPEPRCTGQRRHADTQQLGSRPHVQPARVGRSRSSSLVHAPNEAVLLRWVCLTERKGEGVDSSTHTPKRCNSCGILHGAAWVGVTLNISSGCSRVPARTMPCDLHGPFFTAGRFSVFPVLVFNHWVRAAILFSSVLIPFCLQLCQKIQSP